MNCSIIRSFFLLPLLSLSLFSSAQIKNLQLPKFSNPFESRKAQAFNEFITHKQPESEAGDKIPQPRIEVIDGSFSSSLEKFNFSKDVIGRQLPGWLKLSRDHSFRYVTEKTDDLGYTHTQLQQHYKGVLVDGYIIFIHSKNGKAMAINGRVAEFEGIDVTIAINDELAKEKARLYTNVQKTLNEYPVTTVVTVIPGIRDKSIKLAKKVRIDSENPFVMCNVFIDAQTGELLNKINLVAHTDAVGTAQTLYSGAQNMTSDNFGSGFRLWDNARKIQTYDATSATSFSTSGFIGSTDYVNTSANWGLASKLSSLTISSVSTNWWYTALSDEAPDIYINIKNSFGQIVYSSPVNDNATFPLEINDVNLYLTNPPYSIELWDRDVADADDFGGSFNLALIVGTQSWSVNGNTGKRVVVADNNPALDVHWGLQKCYDFYSVALNRNSYDGNNGSIKQFVNPPNLQASRGSSPNNAFAIGIPYNIMAYGLGDGSLFGPVVGLDVVGHEYTHLVVDNNGNGGLDYQGESGALNESFADIFGSCVEFFSGVNADWLIGEDVTVSSENLRSMSNPKNPNGLTQQPDTYGKINWVNPNNLSYDYGGVHINSGVQNYWFYLLSQGGSGTNDLGNAYTVTGIGIANARRIAYRNLTTYLGPKATFFDAFNGSLQAAQDLFGITSQQYNSVRQAWYAVGIGNNPTEYCSGTTVLTNSSGTISDGSGSANYDNNVECKWVIAPSGATQISLKFTFFDTENLYDTVFVYDGADENAPLLATWWGNTLPPILSTTEGIGAMCIKFKSDADVVAAGWSADYTSTGITPGCEGVTILSNPSGSFNDGSGSANYQNNQLCYWYIAPPCAQSVTISFSQFNTEEGYDGVLIYDGADENANQLAAYSGTNIPASVTSATGKMLVIFTSDHINSLGGFTASYTSTGSATCSGVTNLNTEDYGTLSDGSGSSNYCNNLDCKWLIQPPQASAVTLTFTSFDLEEPSTDGKIYYDFVEIYDGATTSAPLLGRFAGNTLPPSITSTGGSMLVRLFTDPELAKDGFTAYFTSTQDPYCTNAVTKLTSSSGVISDGSGNEKYANNSYCSWLIQPPGVNNIKLSFSSFDTEQDFDGIIVYDGSDNTAAVLGTFTGNALPSPVQSTGGSMYIEFITDPALRSQGWAASYTSSITTGIDEVVAENNVLVYPNPNRGKFSILMRGEKADVVTIYNSLGVKVYQNNSIGSTNLNIELDKMSPGIYIVQVAFKNKKPVNKKIIIKR